MPAASHSLCNRTTSQNTFMCLVLTAKKCSNQCTFTEVIATQYGNLSVDLPQNSNTLQLAFF